jgi:hypothetical protein
VSNLPYNYYTMLRSVEDIFGLSHIGYAGLPGGDLIRVGCVHPLVPALAAPSRSAPARPGARLDRRDRRIDPGALERRRRWPAVHRQVLFSAPAGAGHHRLTIRVLSGVMALEGLAVASRQA